MDKPARQGTESLVDNYSFSGAVLAQAEWTEHRLLYATPELTKPLHISGTPRITIKLASSKPAANLSVWLVSLGSVGGISHWADLPRTCASGNGGRLQEPALAWSSWG